MTSSTRLRLDIIPASTSHVSSIIFLHGAGDTSEGIQEWISSVLLDRHAFTFPRSRVIYPSAPPRPYMGGGPCTVWFDWEKIEQSIPEDLESIDPMCAEIGKVIQQEVDLGIPKNKIILGGLSMGGCMAMHVAYRFQRELAGVFALSSFLNDNSVVYKELAATTSRKPPLFACHGERDTLIRHSWGESTVAQLKQTGVPCQFTSFPMLSHAINKEELQKLHSWIEETLS